ncbi:MAG: GreA/GreB family elongation factor [Kiritimatiellia bacterium]|nr:GreA/GreB family elongation factor [Kiritimatiellia bacterium]
MAETNPEDQNLAIPDTEESFLEQLSERPIPWSRMAAVLRDTAARGGATQAEERARMLEEALVASGEADAALAVLETRAGWMPVQGARSALAAAAEALFRDFPDRKALIRDAGFDRPLSPVECVRRLRVLVGFAPGVLCYEPTWRFGEVRRVDPFGRRVQIDFETKPGHSMILAYAAETVRLLPPDHLLARFHREADAVRALIRENPAAVVESALHSFGPMTAPALQEKLVPRLVDEAGWKTFWDAARKTLKKEGRVFLPAKRSEAMRLLNDGEADFENEWFSRLAAERDMRIILDRVQALHDSGRSRELPAESRAILTARLAFVLKGAEPRHWDLWARAIRLAAACEADGPGVDLDAQIGRLAQESFFFMVLDRIAAREIDPLFALLLARRGADFRALLLKGIPRMDAGPLASAIALLCASGDAEACARVLREQLSLQSASAHLLLWVYRNPERIAEWNLVGLPDLARQTLHVLEQDAGGALLRSQNQIRERFQRAEWLQSVFDAMNPTQQREFFERLKTTPAWPTLDRQAILGRIIKRFPGMEQFMAVSAVSVTSTIKTLTSSRSYRERQKALEKIVREDIPANSRDIGLARAHGDLRENFEYKAAKDLQSVLMRRQAELEQHLKEVQPSDFTGFPSDVAGQATGVEVEYADGRVERVYLLGAWDRDETLGIISIETRLAQALQGKRAGDSFEMSMGQGLETGRIRSVFPLPEEILAWARGG